MNDSLSYAVSACRKQGREIMISQSDAIQSRFCTGFEQCLWGKPSIGSLAVQVEIESGVRANPGEKTHEEALQDDVSTLVLIDNIMYEFLVSCKHSLKLYYKR